MREIDQPKKSPAKPRSRFLTISEVAAELATTNAQIRVLLTSGDLLGIQIGGRRQWRIERVKLEEYIASLYRQALTDSLDDAAGAINRDNDPDATVGTEESVSRVSFR